MTSVCAAYTRHHQSEYHTKIPPLCCLLGCSAFGAGSTAPAASYTAGLGLFHTAPAFETPTLSVQKSSLCRKVLTSNVSLSLHLRINYEVAASGFQSGSNLCLVSSAGDTGLCFMLLMSLQKMLLMCFGKDYFPLQRCAGM